MITTTDKSEVINEESGAISISGPYSVKIFFDDDMIPLLEDDRFLYDMWTKFDALFDWGDWDYFPPEKCIGFKQWLEERLKKDLDAKLTDLYSQMLSIADTAIEYETGIFFNF